MRTYDITIPKLAFVAGTRGMLGVGIGLLAADFLAARQRKRLGLTLLSIGALTTSPIAASIIAARRTRSAW